MSKISAPLKKLLEKEIEWHWDSAQEESFNKLKDMATKAPVLAFYNPKESLTLNVDASSYGLGAVIMQKEKPIYSLCLASSESNSTKILTNRERDSGDNFYVYG